MYTYTLYGQKYWDTQRRFNEIPFKTHIVPFYYQHHTEV